jgi:hypothetical protein
MMPLSAEASTTTFPKRLRPAFLKNMCDHAGVVIIADEGIREYASLEERQANCDGWYGYVIAEANRLGLRHLSSSETGYWQHERKNTADDGGDFKESPTDLLMDASQVGLVASGIDRIGPWETMGGGFFTITFTAAGQRRADGNVR